MLHRFSALSSPLTSPEGNLEQTGTSASNSLANQNPNPVPITTVQTNVETATTVLQNPAPTSANNSVNTSRSNPTRMDRTKLPMTWGKNALKFGGEADALPGYLDAVEDVI